MVCYCVSRWKSSLIVLAADVVAPIEREIRTLSNGLQEVKDEQEYIVVRERTHRNTAESTNARVKWWSVLQAIVLFLVVAWQVYYLKVRRGLSCFILFLTPPSSPSSR
jgi:ABC-type xylose transport system permease subunit